jgi:AmiR/NasT family two-component response regulator
MAATRILVVDDDALIRVNMVEMLNRMGYEVVGEADTAPTAVQKARELKPDLVIMDIRMPGDSDGINAAATLTGENIAPTLLVSAYSQPDYVARANEAGVVGYLVKPVTVDQLRPAIEVVLARFGEFQSLSSETQDLRDQLETRKLVERAKGVLMAQFNLNESEAFRRIQKTSMDTRKPMRAIAEAILLTNQVGVNPNERERPAP